MDNGTRSKSARTRKRTSERTVVATVANDEKSNTTAASPVSPSRSRTSPSNEPNSGLSGVSSSDLASTNDSVKPALRDCKAGVNSEGTRNPKQSIRRGRRTKPTISTEKPKAARKRGRLSSEGGSRKDSIGKNTRVDAAASMLATLDSRAYHRSLLRDANNVNRAILTPMALPWMHSGSPVARNIPCDIDEMPEILTADDGTYSPFENGQFGFGNFAMCQMQKRVQNRQVQDSVVMRTASRRSSDPGVIDLATITIPPNDGPNMALIGAPVDLSYSEGSEMGEISLQCYELEQQRKKRRVEQARSLTRVRLVSVKINSTSSKASIFPKSNCVKFLEAKLPAEVQDGRFLSVSRAKKIAQNLGSYDMRYRLPPTNKSGKNANRVSVGRTRRMWTAKSPADQPQRVYFTSLLTGEKLDSGTQKRPRNVKVTIKVNGKVVGDSDDVSMDSIHNQSRCVYPSMQCTLDSDKLVQNTLKSQKGRNESTQDNLKSVDLSGSTLITPAQLDCVPDNTGVLCVSCTSPGHISISSVHHHFTRAAKQDVTLCTVCWYPKSRQLGDVQECSGCGVLVHPQCCYDSGAFSDGEGRSDNVVDSSTKWTCGVCIKEEVQKDPRELGLESKESSNGKHRRRISRPPVWLKDSIIETLPGNRQKKSSSSHRTRCVLCPYSGGAMSLVKKNGVDSWVHEICRIWTDFAYSPMHGSLEDLQNKSCALCGANANTSISKHSATNSLIKCAAAQCQVYVHPMCAMLASKCVNNKSRFTPMMLNSKTVDKDVSSLQESMEEDLDLSKRFTLTTLDCEAANTTKTGRTPEGTLQSLQIPVCFCGFHNPMREASLYGLYPGGKHLNDNEVMKIPAFSAS